MEYISKIAQAALIVDGYFWNSTSRSHSGWIFLKQWRCKGHEKCIFETPHNEIKCVLSVKESNFNEKKIKIFTFAYGQGRGGWPPPPYGQPDHKISVFLRRPLLLLSLFIHIGLVESQYSLLRQKVEVLEYAVRLNIEGAQLSIKKLGIINNTWNQKRKYEIQWKHWRKSK